MAILSSYTGIVGKPDVMSTQNIPTRKVGKCELRAEMIIRLFFLAIVGMLLSGCAEKTEDEKLSNSIPLGLAA
jgi:hypothetical protein